MTPSLAVASVDPPGAPRRETIGREWMDRAACRGLEPELFFPDDGADPAEAIAVCRCCMVRRECLEYAQQHREPYGIWGGLTPRQRAARRHRDASAARG